MSIIIQHITYIHPDRQLLFEDINFSVEENEKISLIGNNGSGKSTLLKIMAGKLQPSSGEIICKEVPYYVPQHFGQYDHLTVEGALGIENKMNALRKILGGSIKQEYYDLLGDDWNIEERAQTALAFWGLDGIDLNKPIRQLSGGEKTKVLLAGLQVHEPSTILMDEPTNHLDTKSRDKFYEYIESSHTTMMVVSHDRTLLNMIPLTCELASDGVTFYGGNYEFYKQEKEIQVNALLDQIEDKEKTIRKARVTARKVAERRQKQDIRGKKKKQEEGVPRILLNTLRNKAEATTSKLKESHTEKIDTLSSELKELRNQYTETQLLKPDLHHSSLHQGKILVTAQNINYCYGASYLWKDVLNFQIVSGDRILLSGRNGAGKTTLVKLITGEKTAITGKIEKASFSYLYIDQEYSMVDPGLSVLEFIGKHNERHLMEHEIKTLLHRFLFPVDTWNKSCKWLSGGEKMRLLFCSFIARDHVPDMLILDEPTNNLDINTLNILTDSVRQFRGTVLVISHDRYFVEEVGIDKEINLD